MTYWAIARLAAQRQFSYRTANLAGLATNLFFGVLRASVLVALFSARGGEAVAGYTLQDAVTFTGLTQGLLAPLAIFGWWDLMLTIRTGEVGTDLARPIDLYWYWWAQDFGRAAVQLVWRAGPVFGFYALFYRITLPATAGALLATLAALLLGLHISFSWRFLVSLVAFWTRDARGVGRLAWSLTTFFTGFLMPLAFFPPWAAQLMRLTPFGSMLNPAIEIYLGVARGGAVGGLLALQVAWAAALYGLARLVLAAGVRKLVIQGG